MRRLVTLLAAFALSGCGVTPVATATANGTGARDQRRFHVQNSLRLTPPADCHEVCVWLPLPRVEEAQTCSDLRIEAPAGWRQTTDAAGNRYVFVRLEAPRDPIVVQATFDLERHEQRTDVDAARTRPLTDTEREQRAAYLGSNRWIVIDDGIRSLAASIRGDETNPLRVARRLYDWTLANVEYWVKDPGKWRASPVGSSEYCLTNRTGNCTDFHSLWTALARASGLPTRMQYGSLFKASLDGQDRDASYHCWPEFWVPNLGWVPHDVAVADIYAGTFPLTADNEEKVRLTTPTGYDGPSRQWVDYYFGNLDARRVSWSVGRDLVLEPPQQAGPVNAIAKGYVEVDGKEYGTWERKMTYRELPDVRR